MTSQKTKQIKLNPARMEIIKPNHIEENKATLREEDFIVSKEPEQKTKFSTFKLAAWENLHWKYWAIIGSSALFAIGIVVTIICRASGHSASPATPPIQVTNATNITNNTEQPTPSLQSTSQPPVDAKPKRSIWGSMR